MASEISICNQALALLGQGPITSVLEPSTSVEETCKTFYELARDAVLEESEWTFNTRTRNLDPVNPVTIWPIPADLRPNPIGEWFAKPQNALRILTVAKGHNVDFQNYAGELAWYVEGEFIAADADLITIRYLERITDVNRFTPSLQEAMAAKMAYLMAIQITGSRALRNDMKMIQDEALAKAATLDGLQGRQNSVEFSQLIRARR